MAIWTDIDVGTAADDGTGDTLRAACQAINTAMPKTDGLAAGTATTVVLATDATSAITVTAGTTNGVKIGGAVGQKIGFWAVTPVVQPAHADQADQGAMTGVAVGDLVATNNGWGASSEANFDKIHTAIDQLVADVTAIDTLLTAIRTALVNTGIMRGAA